jgi:uncharacterized phage-associated protein
MTTTSSAVVAAELRRRLGSPGDIKVHKLLYYCQGWHLVRTGTPLFADRIEAWANGPVVAGLWRDERYGRLDELSAAGELSPAALPLDDDAMATIDAVLSRFGRFTGKQLIRLSHGERPWVEASENAPGPDWNNQEITHAALIAFFNGEEVGELLRLAELAHGDPLVGPAMRTGSVYGDHAPDDPAHFRERLNQLTANH